MIFYHCKVLILSNGGNDSEEFEQFRTKRLPRCQKTVKEILKMHLKCHLIGRIYIRDELSV